MLGTGFFLKIAKIDCQQEKAIYPNPAFQLILSSGGLCRPSERTPRDHMLILFIIFKLTLICNLSGHEALFVGPLTCLLSGKLLIAKISARKTHKKNRKSAKINSHKNFVPHGFLNCVNERP